MGDNELGIGCYAKLASLQALAGKLLTGLVAKGAIVRQYRGEYEVKRNDFPHVE